MMTPRINLIGVCAISILCILLIFASQRFTTTNYATEYYKPGDMKGLRLGKNGKNYNHKYAIDPSGSGGTGSVTAPTAYNTTVTIGDILTAQRQRIAEEMENFEYSRDAEQLSALTPESGGTPYQSVIITTWRSGSTFLGDILNAMPGNYYHYEPLLNFDIIQIRGPPHDKRAVHNLKQLLSCNYTAMDDYLDYGQTHNYLFSHNTRLWRYCRLYPQHCWDPNFLSPFCKLFPMQSMKVVRLRLALAEQLIDDARLNIRVVLLIRDPRGTLQSRKHREWCPGKSDCDDPATLCKDMVSDYYAAEILSKKYPQKFKAVRYEDLSLDPYKMTQEILDFYGLPFDPQVEEFLDSHTRSDIGGVSSTFRDSKSAPFHWIHDLAYDEISDIQESCTKAMQLWGYRPADETTILQKSFNPMLSFTLS